jgi:site-specific recombinase XerD
VVAANSTATSSIEIRRNLLLKETRAFHDTLQVYQETLQQLRRTLRDRSTHDVKLVEPSLTDDEANKLVKQGAAAASCSRGFLRATP